MSKAVDYKGYKIIIKWGVGFEIMKEYRGKYFELSRQNFHFTDLDQPLQRACNYIDQYPGRLESKFKYEFILFCEELHNNPGDQAYTGVDISYYLKAYKKLNNNI